MAVNQLFHQLSRKLEDMNIDTQKEGIELVPVNHQTYHNYANDTMISDATLASSEVIGDVASMYSSLEDFCEVPVIAGSNGLLPPTGCIYTGAPGAMDTHEYMQYPMDGMHYYNPIDDYNYGAQPVYGDIAISTDMHYPLQTNDGYVYDHQVYQYPMQAYYQQAPVPPYGYGGEVIMLDAHEQPVVMPNAYNNFFGSIPISFDPRGNGAVVFTPPYPSHIGYPPQTLRASAPAWIEASTEAKCSVKSCKSEVSRTHQLFASNKGNNKATNGTSVKTDSVQEKDNTVPPTTFPVPADTKGSTNSKLYKKEDNKQHIDANSGVKFPALRCALQVKSAQPIAKASAAIPKKEAMEYGKHHVEDFFVKYEDARFFIIKSYSEENVFRSIQYGVWASTPNGNKKLDDAYRDAQGRAVGKQHGCPVILFFSVNGSRQFCGVAEMVGHVDYKKSMEFWEQHKWSGSFPVVWRCIKDVPNSMFRRVILQNNENKPVTNSRDTQEVILAQGLEMLEIMKSYCARTSIMDEFGNAFPCPIRVKPMAELKPLKQPSHRSFPRTGQEISATQREEERTTDLRPSNGTTLIVCEKGSKPKGTSSLLVKSLHSKLSPPTVVVDFLGKERQKVNDKENIKLVVKGSVLATA